MRYRCAEHHKPPPAPDKSAEPVFQGSWHVVFTRPAGHRELGADPPPHQSSRVALLRPLLGSGPESLPLHDVPKLAQVGLGDGVVGLELQRAQVVGLRFGELTVEVEDGAEVHQSGRVLGRGKDKGQGKRVKTEGQEAQRCLLP